MRQCSAADFVDRINILRVKFAANADFSDPSNIFGTMVNGERVWVLNGITLAKVTAEQRYFICEDFES